MNTICFSETASLTAATALLAMGAISVGRTRRVTQVPYACIPLLFSVQQFIEAKLWQVLPGQTPTTHLLTVAYLLFSNVLWPIYVPAAIWLLEPRRDRRRMIALTVVAGIAVGVFFLSAIAAHPVTAVVVGMHVKYHIPHHHDPIAVGVYAVATCLAPLLSSQKMVQLFGAILISSMLVAAVVYFFWFASVWCFFAAILSVLVILQFLNPNECATEHQSSPNI